MFGAYVRASIAIAAAVLCGAILQYVVPFFLKYQGPEDSLLYRSFEAIADNGMFIMLVAVAAALLARAVVESTTAGVRR